MMIVGARLLLLELAMMASLQVSDPRVDGQRKVAPTCEKAIVGCGEFHPPSNKGAKTYNCKFNKRKCDFVCTFSCKKGPDGKRMRRSDRRRRRDLYRCVKNKWTRVENIQGYCKTAVIVKEAKQNLHHTVELNELTNSLIQSSFCYLTMASLYERADVALPGFNKLMTKLWEEDMKHARELMKYVNKRGGYINIEWIPRSTCYEDLLMTLKGRTGLTGVIKALNETRDSNSHALKVHSLAMEHLKTSDPHMKHFLEDGLLNYKVDTIKKLADLHTQLKSFTTDEDYTIGEYSIDLELRE